MCGPDRETSSLASHCKIQTLSWNVFLLLGKICGEWCSVQGVEMLDMQTHLRSFDVYEDLKREGRFCYLFLYRTLEECWPVKVRAELATSTVSLTYRQLSEDGKTVEKFSRIVKPGELNKLDFSGLFGRIKKRF